ncbi:MAG: cupin domain-containing protein [Marivibrio sp.]|uniref:cupin domain-containing protein n=1 Tax=Marivibrio sp. TaxID=2039719 RepID=UPI0032EE4117
MAAINADFDARVLIHSADLPWVASPMPGVERRMLDRLGDEVARATSVVRYAPASAFSPHTHGGGEEFLVLDGVFQDEHGDYPTGTYVRNPPTSRHTPGSAPGCTILVKLWQFDPDDRTPVRVETAGEVGRAAEDRPGVRQLPLFEDARECVRIETWRSGSVQRLADHGGLELFILDGALSESGDALKPGSWLRLPPDRPLEATAGPAGARLWVKTGHLARGVSAPAD